MPISHRVSLGKIMGILLIFMLVLVTGPRFASMNCPIRTLSSTECFLDSSYGASVCQYTKSEGTLNLTDCKCKEVNARLDALQCFSIENIERLAIETEHLTNIQPGGLSNSKFIPTSLVVKNPEEYRPDMNAAYPILPPFQFNVEQVEIIGFGFSDYSLLMSFLKTSAPRAQILTIKSTVFHKADNKILIMSKNLPMLRSITMRDCQIDSMFTGALQFTKSTTDLELYNVRIGGQLSLSAIHYDLNDPPGQPNSPIRVAINKCNLGSAEMGKEPFIRLRKDSADFMSFQLDLRDNAYDGTIPEDVFGDLVRTHWDRTDLNITLYTDPINCCDNSIQWLVDYLGKREHKISNVIAECLDVKGDITAESLAEKCGHKRVYPILTIVIVAILVLAAVLAIVSVVCIFYILPRKGNVIRITTARSTASNVANSNIQSGFSKTGESKDLSVYEINSSKTNFDSKLGAVSTKMSKMLRPETIRNSDVKETVPELLKVKEEANLQRGAHTDVKEVKNGDDKIIPAKHVKLSQKSSDMLILPKYKFKLPNFKSPSRLNHKEAFKKHSHKHEKQHSPRLPDTFPKQPILTDEAIRHKAADEISPKGSATRHDDRMARNRKSPRSPMSPIGHHSGSRESKSPTQASNHKELELDKAGKTSPSAVKDKAQNRSNHTRMSHAFKTILP